MQSDVLQTVVVSDEDGSFTMQADHPIIAASSPPPPSSSPSSSSDLMSISSESPASSASVLAAGSTATPPPQQQQQESPSSSSSSPAPTPTPPIPAANTAKLPKSSSSTKGMGCGRPGYITCSICSATKYYSHVQRRFGQFSCEPCSKFMKRFLRDPKKFTCFESGNCLIGRPSGEQEPRGVSVSRCKACWLKICLEKFVLEPNTREAIQQHYQPLFVTSPASANQQQHSPAADSSITGIQMMMCGAVHDSSPGSPSSCSDPHRRGSDAPDPSNCSSSGVSVSSHASSSSRSSESLPLPLPLPQRKRKLQSSQQHPGLKSMATAAAAPAAGDRVPKVRRRPVVSRRRAAPSPSSSTTSSVIPGSSQRPAVKLTSSSGSGRRPKASPVSSHHVNRSSGSSFNRKQHQSSISSTSLSSTASSSSKLSSRIIRSDHFHHHMDLDRDDELDFLHEDDHRYSRCQKTFNQEFYEAADDEDEEEDEDDEEEDQEEEDDEGYDDFFDPFAVRSLLPDSLFFDEILNTNSPFL